MLNQFVVGDKPKLILSFTDDGLKTKEYTFLSDDVYFAAVNDPDVEVTELMSKQYLRFLDFDRIEMESAWYYVWTEIEQLNKSTNLNIFEVQRLNYLNNQLARLEDGVYFDDVGNKIFLDQDKYYPYLKQYRGAETHSIPDFLFNQYPDFHTDNKIAFKYTNSELIGLVKSEILDKVRKFMIDQARIIREVVRYDGFIYDSHRFSGDRIVQADISGILMQYQLATIPQDFTYRWKITNGSYYDFNGFDSTLDFSQKLAQFIGVAFAREEFIAKEIATTSLEDLLEYDIHDKFKQVNSISFNKTEPTKF